MFFPKLTLTDAGRALIVKGMAGATINFTKLALGNGEAPENIRGMTELSNLIADMQITNIEVGEGCAELEGSFDNGDLSTSFFASELGVYAEDPDSGEVLYAYANAGERAAYMPAYSESSFERTTFKLVVVIGDAEHVTAIIGEYSGYTTKEEFEGHKNDKENPHNVTKEQVGLENVPNVSTNNQTPTFSALTLSQNANPASIPLENIASGETLSVMLGKIRNVIARVFHHFNAVNPHGITTSSIGAASATHKHSATDITSGTLGEARGGTGQTSIANFLHNYGLDFFRVKSGWAVTNNSNTIQIPLQNGLNIVMGKTSVHAEANSKGYGSIDWSPTNYFSRAPFVFATINTDTTTRHVSVTNVTRKGFDLVFQNTSNSANTNTIYYFAIG